MVVHEISIAKPPVRAVRRHPSLVV